MKAKHYYKEVIKMQLLVTLLPSLLQKYKNLDRKTVFKALKKFIIATVWLELCYAIPNISNCVISKYSPISSKILYVIGFFLGNCGCVIDTPSRIKQYACFMAPKNLEFFVAMLVIRGKIAKVFYTKYL